METILNELKINIPAEHKTEFNLEIFKNNFYRLKYISIILLLLEIPIYIYRESFFSTGIVILAFMLFDVVMIPLIWYCHKNYARLNGILLNIVQYAFSLAILFFGMGLTFLTQRYTDLVHMYFMMIFGVVFFLYIKPPHSMPILFLSYTAFFFLLPIFQHDPNNVFVIRINALSVNIFAWVVSRFLYKMRLNLFLDKIIIQEKNKDLEELVLRDSMTKLYNHETAISLLEDEIKRYGKEHPMSILIADIDEFKQINDVYGHLTGDYVIKKVAKVIEGVMRSSDHICRYGGDEFFIIMPGTDLKSAFACAQRIQAAIKSTDFNMDSTPTMSGGISQYNGETIKEFIALTDEKLYCAKKSGKNKFK